MKGSRRDNTDPILPVLPPSLEYPREITPTATLPAHKRAALDLATIGVLADGGLRRSEAAALTWGDVELWPDGTGRLTVQKGKNQVEPTTVAVTPRPPPAPCGRSVPRTPTPQLRCSG